MKCDLVICGHAKEHHRGEVGGCRVWGCRCGYFRKKSYRSEVAEMPDPRRQTSDVRRTAIHSHSHTLSPSLIPLDIKKAAYTFAKSGQEPVGIYRGFDIVTRHPVSWRIGFKSHAVTSFEEDTLASESIFGLKRLTWRRVAVVLPVLEPVEAPPCQLI